jgi:hypothetical protein
LLQRAGRRASLLPGANCRQRPLAAGVATKGARPFLSAAAGGATKGGHPCFQGDRRQPALLQRAGVLATIEDRRCYKGGRRFYHGMAALLPAAAGVATKAYRGCISDVTLSSPTMAVTNGGARPLYMDGGGGAVRRCAAPVTPRQGFYGDDSSRFASGAIFGPLR